MSLLTDFIANVAPQAETIIGVETLSIGGGTVIGVIASETQNAREFSEIGMDPNATLEVVALTSVFAAAYTAAAKTYVGKSAVCRGLTFRVSSVSVGASFTKISLGDVNAA